MATVLGPEQAHARANATPASLATDFRAVPSIGVPPAITDVTSMRHACSLAPIRYRARVTRVSVVMV